MLKSNALYISMPETTEQSPYRDDTNSAVRQKNTNCCCL